MYAVEIWRYFQAKGLTVYGVAGLMGNLYAESRLNPQNLQNTYEKSLNFTDAAYTAAVDNGTYTNFVYDKAGYGLAQWTYWSRKQALLAFAKAAGKSIGDLYMQLDFLWKELTESYSGVLAVLRSATSVLEASNAVLLNFEKPASKDTIETQTKRAGYGQTYYDQFCGNGGTVVSYTNSPLVDCVKMSPNHSGKRTHRIDRITPHCVIGQCSAERIGDCFPAGRQASCNYGIGYDGRVCLIVDEANRSWCTSSNANDQRAITIECASDSTHPYAFKDACYKKLVKLCIDICQRNSIKKMLWIDNKDKALAYEPKDGEGIFTVHRWYANKSCPGDWMYSRMGQLCNEVNAGLNEEDDDMTELQVKEICKQVMTEQRKELQDNDCGTWSKEARDWATSIGLISGGGTLPDGTPNYMWADNLTREQAAALFFRFAQMMGKA